MRQFIYPLIVGLIVVLTSISAKGQETEGFIAISVRDVTTGYALPAWISISRVKEDGSTGPVIDSFRIPVDQEVLKRYPVGRYIIQIEMEDYQPMKSQFAIEAGKKIGNRYMLSPAEAASLETRSFQLEEAPISPNTAVITGYVTDNETGQPLEGVHIRFDRTGVEVYTDHQGYFTASITIKESLRLGDQEVKALEEDIIFPLPGYKTLKEVNVLLVAQRHLGKNVTMFKGEGEIIHDRTHPLLMPPERQKELQKYRSSEGPSAALTSLEHSFLSSEIIEGEGKKTLNLMQAITAQLQIRAPPALIRVGFSSTGGPCSPTGAGGYPVCDSSRTQTFTLENYVRLGWGDEWLTWWGVHSLRAGAVAYRSYGAKHVYYPDGHSGSNYDICSSPVCQNFDPDDDFLTSQKTAGIMLQKGSILFEAEYSAENNCRNSSSCTNLDLSCGNCYVGSPTYGWPCLYDSVGCDQYCSGHGRGMSQWGTYRWDLQVKTWVWMVNHYYNANGGADGGSSGQRTAYITSPLEITNTSPTPSSVSPGQTFQISINANNYAGLSHTQIIIGASLYSSSTGYINNTANDKKVTLNPGSNIVTRPFTIPSSTPGGIYDLIVVLWLDVNEDGIINTDIDLSSNSKTLSQAITVTSSSTTSTTSSTTTSTVPTTTTSSTSTIPTTSTVSTTSTIPTTSTISTTSTILTTTTSSTTSTVSPLPNLTPYQPSGWSDKIVVSKVTGTNTDSSPLYTTDTLYVDFAVLNNGGSATAATVYTKLYIDGVEKVTGSVSPPWNANWYYYWYDYWIGSLSAGAHTIKVVADATGAIAESIEGDNEYTKTITVLLPPDGTTTTTTSSTTTSSSTTSTSSSTTTSSTTSTIPGGGWTSVPGGCCVALVPPAAAVDSSGIIDLFVKGMDSSIYYKLKTAAGWSSTWTQLSGGGATPSTPVPAINGASRLVAVRGFDQALWANRDGVWTGLAGRTEHEPGAAPWGGGFIAAVRGLDKAVWLRLFNGSSWGSWQPLGGGTSGPPTVVQDGSMVRVIITGLDGQFWMKSSSDGISWSSWQPVPGGGNSPEPPSAAVVNGELKVVVRGYDNNVWVNTLNATRTQSLDWQALPPPPDYIGRPWAVADGSTLRVFVTGTDQTIYTYP